MSLRAIRIVIKEQVTLPGSNEYSNRPGAGLKNTADTHDTGTQKDGRPATDTIHHIRSKWISYQWTDILNSIEQPKHPAFGMVEVSIPLWYWLQSVHHTWIVAIGRGRNEEEENPAIEKDYAVRFSSLSICMIKARFTVYCYTIFFWDQENEYRLPSTSRLRKVFQRPWWTDSDQCTTGSHTNNLMAPQWPLAVNFYCNSVTVSRTWSSCTVIRKAANRRTTFTLSSALIMDVMQCNYTNA